MGTSVASVLVVDDEPDLRMLYELTLLREGHRVDTAASVAEARAHLKVCRFDVVITDMRLPDGLGMELLHDLRAQQRTERTIVMTAYGTADNAVQALRQGAFDYLTKPVDLKQFRAVVASAVRQEIPSAAPGLHRHTPPGQAAWSSAKMGNAAQALERMVGTSAAMQQVKQRIQKVAPSMAPVLITGESGTGKELVARALHACSHRSQGPWVAVNCGAIPEHLLEAEFFGVTKGAYTGATADREGFFAAARGGTLFLDEMGELPLSMQAKLLRAIQERSVRRLGATQEEAVDVRIVSATHRDLGSEVQRGSFRQDLYYRLNVVDIHLPPLRERREDIPLLCMSLLQRMAGEGFSSLPQLPAHTLRQLQQHPLRGNVRELENLLYRALVLHEDIAPGTALAQLGSTLAQALPLLPDAGRPEDADALPCDLQAWLDQQERSILIRALQACGYNRTAAAARLGISLRQMRYRIERLQIPLSPDDADRSTSDNALYDAQH